ncbi:MAG: transcriptional regulator [Sphingomonadales bacterium]|nr:transcriptional regulator [Sphingomonadales bacterium]
MNAGDPRVRLLELARARAVSLAALSGMIGRNASYLQQFVRKGSPRKLEEGDRRTLARFFAIAESELGGTEEISHGQRAARMRGEWADIPRLSLGASAGPGTLAEGEASFDSFRFSTRWLRRHGLDPAQLSAILVTGDSMEPLLRDGDEILVDRSPRPLGNGIYVIRVGEALMVKRLDVAQPGRIGLISDNAVYPPLWLAPEEVAVTGRVVWKSGRL